MCIAHLTFITKRFNFIVLLKYLVDIRSVLTHKYER